MTYRVNYTDDTKSPIIVQDGDVDTSTNIGLVGRGYTGFGEVVAENFLHLLENFSDETPPARPVEGQLWYNNTNSSMYYYTVAETWKKIGNVRTESFNPILNDGEVNGDVWLNTSTNDLYIFSSPNWVLMANGDISTKVYTRTRKDNATPIGTHKTIEIVVANKVVAVFSSDLTPWTPNSTGSNTEYLDDGSIMANIYNSIKLGINLVNRKSITEVTVSTTNPTTGTTSQYVEEGDMWVNKTENRLYTYTSGLWKRINNYVKVRASTPVIENDEQSGDLWINTLNDKIYYYNPTTSTWEFLASNTTFSTSSPQSTDIRNSGDYWINTTTQQIYSYDGSNWINLSFQEKGTFVITKNRLDINNVSHKTLETIVNGKTIKITSSDTVPWVPNQSEITYEGGQYALKFLNIVPGDNITNDVGEITITTELGPTPTTSVEYDIWKNYGLDISARIRIKNTSTWQTPPHITNSNTAPTSPVKYDVWITLENYEIKVYNGSTWIYPTTIFENGKTSSVTEHSARMFNGIATKQAISGSYRINFNSFTAGTTFYNGTIMQNGTSVPSNTVSSASVYLYPKQWRPVIKGNITVEFNMIALTAFEYQITRRPVDSNGNVLDDHKVMSGSWSSVTPDTTTRTLVLPFLDVVSVYLPSYYPVDSDGPFRIRYALQIKKTGTSLITSFTSIDLQPYFSTSDSTASTGGPDNINYYIDYPS